MKPEVSPSELVIPQEALLSAAGVIAQNLLIARTALELTQQELADTSGISRATIAQLEAGLGDPRLSTLEMLSRTLHIPPLFLLFDQATFRAVAELPAANQAGYPKKPGDGIARMLLAGGSLSRLRAASLGVEAAREAGLTGEAYSVGAAIGAARLAAKGTFLGAHLAHLLKRFKPPTPPPSRRPDEFSHGEGI